MFASLNVAIPWREIVKRTITEAKHDNCLGLAAQLAFYFLLAVFPALLFLIALIAYVPVETALSELLAALGTVAPHHLVDLLRQQVSLIARTPQKGFLILGIVGAIWSSSAAMVAIIDAMNRAFGVTEWRPWWRRRLVAIGLTITLALFTVLALGLMLVGPVMTLRVASWLGIGPAVALVWQLVRWLVIIYCVVLSVDLAYHLAPNRHRRWAWVTPGSVLATAIWVAASLAFKLYVSRFEDYTAAYGAIGGAIVAMLWFYVSSVAILIGAELNAVIEDTPRAVGG
jgi:membrane protein